MTENETKGMNEIYRLMLENIDEIIFAVETNGDLMEGKVQFVGNQVEKFVGYSPDDFIKDPGLWFRCIHPDDLEELKESTEQLASTKKSVRRAYRFRHKLTGEYVWIEDRFSPQFDKEGNFRGYAGVARDITECKQAEEALREDREYLATLMDTLADAVFTVELPARHIEYINRAATEMFGYEPHEVIGHSTRMFYYDDKSYAAFGERLRNALAEGKPLVCVELELRKKSGDPLWAEVSTSFLSAAGKPLKVISVIRDVTERKRVEIALRESEQKHRLVLDNVGEIVYKVNFTDKELVQGKVEFVSGRVENILGYRPTEFMANPGLWLSLVHPDDSDAVRQTTASILETKAAATREYRMRHKTSGEYDWMEDRVVLQCDESGNVICIFGVARDVTDRKKNEEKLLLLSNALEHAANCVFTTDKNGVIEFVNEAFVQVTGYAKVEAIGKTPRILKSGKHTDVFYTRLWEKILAGETFRAEVVNRKKNGELFIDDRTIVPIRNSHGNITHFVSTGRDITDRRKMEREILEVSAREQQRIGQDLHDSLGQHLTGIGFLVKSLEERLEAKANPEVANVRQLAELVNQAIEQTHSLARGLVPVSLESNDIVEALRNLSAHVEKVFQIRCTFRGGPAASVVDNTSAIHLYRIAQEAVTNAVKHGRASHVAISLDRDERNVVLKVEDNGVGVRDDGGRKPGLGMRIMNYRANMIDATLEVKRSTSGGTAVICLIESPKNP